MESDRRVAHNRRAVPDDLEMLLERIRALIDANAEGAGLPRREVEPTLTEGYARALELDAECLRLEHRIDRLTMEIAAALHISPKTVKNHISNILMKLQIENRIQAAVYAVRSGIV